jgi:Rieske 2Fe-2S family protein
VINGATTVAGINLDETLRDVSSARHAPGLVYCSADMLALEKRNIFERDWLFVAREEELPNPGDYLTLDILGEPIIVSRDQSGKLSAFANSCLHRGVAVAQGKGNAARFTCPYHAWTYDTSGKLIGAPMMDEVACFNKATARLKPLGLRVWKGNVMVTLNPKPVDFDSFIAPFEPAAEFSRPELCSIAHTMMIKFPCNWKMCVENVLDLYHVGTVHGASLGRAFNLDWGGSGLRLAERGSVLVQFNQGYPTHDGESRFGRLPWLTPEIEQLGVAGQFYLEPNFLISAAPDMLRLLSFWPTSPSTTDLMIRMLIPTERTADPELAEKIKVYSDYAASVFAEDTGIMGSLQKAAASGLYEPGSFARMESPVHHVMSYLLSRGLDSAGALR